MSKDTNPQPAAFPEVGSQQWKQRVQYELKGEDYNQSLVWTSAEGISVNPLYAAQPALPSKNAAGSFQICQEIFVHDIEKSAKRAHASLKKGADSLRFRFGTTTADASQLLSGITLEEGALFFDIGNSIDFADSLQRRLKGGKSNVFLLSDPIHHLAKTGNWMEGGDNFKLLETLHQACPEAGFLSINTALYANAGAHIVQQIGYGLAHLAEYLNRFKSEKPIVFEVAMGPEYFFEIAKIRAMRLGAETLAKAFGHTAGFHFYASPGLRNKTLYDYNVNMLRTTTECMSAVLGGADTVSNLPYDAIYHKSNEFGERIARNQLLLLKHESYFGNGQDPASGSHYIESLTSQLTEKALELLKETEREGGLVECLKKGSIQKDIRIQADREQSAFDEGRKVLVGTNKYPDPQNRMKDDLELYPFLKQNPRKTLLVPLIEKRLAEAYEKDRLEKEKQHS